MCSLWQGHSICFAACCRLPAISPPIPACPLQFYELARKEIGALILSDEHPNIVRCFAMEEDSEFVYLALERCRQSLADLVTGEGGSVFLVDEAKHPTPFCMQASRRWRPSGNSLVPVSSVLWQVGRGSQSTPAQAGSACTCLAMG